MALGFYFAPESMNEEKYDSVLRKLEAAGQGAPPGRLHHVAFTSRGSLHVFDIWESQESFDSFGQTLMPILEESGINPGQPEVVEVYNIIEG